MRRILRRLIPILLVLHISLSAALYWAMVQPPDAFGRVMARVPLPMMMVLPFETLWKMARGGVLKPGDTAPDFLLPTLDRRGTVQLSAERGTRPVVLVFGSYT